MPNVELPRWYHGNGVTLVYEEHIWYAYNYLVMTLKCFEKVMNVSLVTIVLKCMIWNLALSLKLHEKRFSS